MPGTDSKTLPPDPADSTRADPARVDPPGDVTPPPEAGSDAARNEERKTQPSRNRGAANI